MSTPEYCYELWQNDEFVASADSTDQQEAEREIQHYALMYGQDGPVEIRRYIRTELATEADATEAQLRAALGRLAAMMKRANEIMLHEAGVGIIDLNVIAEAEALAQQHKEPSK